MVSKDMVDLSHWNGGAIDFHAAQGDGVQGFYHKATEGGSYVDPKFAERERQALLTKARFGGYHFARRGFAKSQAKHFLSVAQPKPGDLRPMLDLEDAKMGGWSIAKRTRWVGKWVAVVQEATGVEPVIYTRFPLADNFNCPLWVARYSDAMAAPSVPSPWKAWSIWQFTNGQFGSPNTVAGIGRCDINTFNRGITVDLLTIADQRKPKLTRGKAVRAALSALKGAKGKGERRKLLDAAKAKLLKIKRFPAKGK